MPNQRVSKLISSVFIPSHSSFPLVGYPDSLGNLIRVSASDYIYALYNFVDYFVWIVFTPPWFLLYLFVLDTMRIYLLQISVEKNEA